jgi:hypothetical protein
MWTHYIDCVERREEREDREEREEREREEREDRERERERGEREFNEKQKLMKHYSNNIELTVKFMQHISYCATEFFK